MQAIPVGESLVEPVSGLRRHAALLPIVTISALANFWSLRQVGWGNAYYAAGVRSMGTSLRSFLFNSLDSGNYVTVDKPPMALWIQTISTKLFGYNQYSVLVPQALMGTLSVVLLYVGIQRCWGRLAGCVAAAALAISPITVMSNHTNNTDAALVFLMTATAVVGVEATRRGKLHWLLGASVLGGMAVLTKMAAAVPVLPGLLLAYLWCAPNSWKRRTVHTVLGALTVTTVGLSWFVALEIIPAKNRPYIGSTRKNSSFELAFERNGVNQVEGTMSGLGGGAGGRGGVGGGRGGFGGGNQGGFGRQGGLQSIPGGPGSIVGPNDGNGGNFGGLLPGPDGLPGVFPGGTFPGGGGFGPGGFGGGGPGGGPGGGMGIGFSGGQPGNLRLFNSDLGTQNGWLLPLALMGALCALCFIGLRSSRRLAPLVVFGGWFAIAGGAFSITKGIVHPYYLAQLGPPIAALAGIGVATFVAAAKSGGWRRLLCVGLPVSLALTAWGQWTILRRVPWRRYGAWVTLVVLGMAILCVLMVLVVRCSQRWVTTAAALASVAAMFAPASYLQGSIASGTSGTLPYAIPYRTQFGAGLSGGITPNGGFQFSRSNTSSLVSYLRANRTTERWLVGVPSAGVAEPIIITTGEPVMATGGFIGSDPILTETTLRAHINAGRIRYFMTSTGGFPGGGGFRGGGGILGGGAGRGGPGGNNIVTSWVTTNCSLVDETVWNKPQVTSTTDSNNTDSDTTDNTTAGAARAFPGGPTAGQFILYDCKGKA